MRNGESGAIEALQNLLRRGLTRTFSGRGIDAADVDDFAQSAVIRIRERLDSFNGQSRFATWAMAVGLRVAYTELRRRRWRDVSLEALPHAVDVGRPSSAPLPPAAAAHQDLLEVLRRAIDEQLTERQRTVVLAELAGVPQAVIAERLGSRLNAVYKVNHDARKKLRQALEAAGFSATDVRDILKKASDGQ